METITQQTDEHATMAELLDINLSDLFPEESQEPVNTMDVSRQIYVIRKLEKQIEQYVQQDREAHYFYTERMNKCEERIAFLKQCIQGFLRHNHLKNIQTPNGTAFLRNLTIRQWPTDDILLPWLEANAPDAVRVKREPDKKAATEYFKSTGSYPDGYEERPETRVYIK